MPVIPPLQIRADFLGMRRLIDVVGQGIAWIPLRKGRRQGSTDGLSHQLSRNCGRDFQYCVNDLSNSTSSLARDKQAQLK